MLKDMARQARNSLGRVRSGMFKNQEPPVLKAKVKNLMVPPPLPKDLADDNMDASFFITAWDLQGRGMDYVAKVDDLLPVGFDVYVIGLQNCSDVHETVERCQDFLSSQDDYEEFTHLMIANEARSGLGMVVLCRRSLVDQSAFNMTLVDTVRDRRTSTMPLLYKRNALTMSQTPETALAQLRAAPLQENGGAVYMRFDFFDSNLLFVHMKESCLGELNEILARVSPEQYAHVFLFGDFGSDVLDNADELAHRLFLEDFDKVPMRFRDSRHMLLTRSQDEELRKLVHPNLHGHYTIARPKSTYSTLPVAFFSTYRIHGGSGIDRSTLPPPPAAAVRNGGPQVRFSEAPPPFDMDDFTFDQEDDHEERAEIDNQWKNRNPKLKSNRYSQTPPPPPPPPPPAGEPSRTKYGRTLPRRQRHSSKADNEVPPPPHYAPPPTGKDKGFITEGDPLLHKAINSLRVTVADAEDEEKPKQSFGTCKVCDHPIENQGELFRCMGNAYHRDCVSCDDCGEPINSQFYIVDGKILCKNSYKKLYLSEKCFGCGQVANPRDQLLRVNNKVFHLDCFSCNVCGVQLYSLDGDGNHSGADEFVIDEEEGLLCAKHGAKYDCVACGEPVPNSEAVQTSFEDGKTAVFHSKCFRCAKCKKAIADLGGSYVMYGDSVLCQDDYTALREAAQQALCRERHGSKD